MVVECLNVYAAVRLWKMLEASYQAGTASRSRHHPFITIQFVEPAPLSIMHSFMMPDCKAPLTLACLVHATQH